MTPLITVVLATRDRPQLFAEALDSVLAQQGVALEVVVVNDGTAAQHLPAYEAVWAAARQRLGDGFSAHTLVHRPKGHGQSYSLNYGVAQARGDYVCFLDDDDKWTDDGHLARVAAAIAASAAAGQVLDLYMANQDAWINDGERVGTLWLGKLAGQMDAAGRGPDAQGLYAPTVEDLMAADGFCHLNCLTVRRALFQEVGGMDEGIRWECDRDLLLKLVEAARTMRHHPKVMSYHRVPDPKKAANMTTALGMVDKRLLQVLVMDRAIARTRHPAILRHVRDHKAYALQKASLELARAGEWGKAAHYACSVLGLRPTPGWLVHTLRCLWRQSGTAAARADARR